ncbi:MAG: DUF92 domain-containing protein [Candidatus Thermoplasmatota archaeon]|nr:DUF92 domain-containing protein [Candidatus Thermoplasmatota archaeon]MEC7253996.1 DUF92 domain-containing protein [Candidatus Thermoplasmatota archaeon]
MDFTSGGFVSGNIIITTLLIIALVSASLRARILDKNGVIAAALLGFFVGSLGHWTWLLLLLCFLLSSHVATKWRFEEKTARGLNESSDGHRGWINVAANGGMPALVALLAFVLEDWEHGLWMFAAAVAVATSDTWASEIGCLDNRVRMITTFKPCEAGVNGGFSPNGQLAAAVGGILIGISALIASLVMFSLEIGESIQLAGVVAGLGFIGCQIDSLLGAVLENRGFLTKGSVNALSIIAGVGLMWLYLGSPM